MQPHFDFNTFAILHQRWGNNIYVHLNTFSSTYINLIMFNSRYHLKMQMNIGWTLTNLFLFWGIVHFLVDLLFSLFSKILSLLYRITPTKMQDVAIFSLVSCKCYTDSKIDIKKDYLEIKFWMFKSLFHLTVTSLKHLIESGLLEVFMDKLFVQ